MKNLTWQNPEQLFVAQELINKVKSKCCGIKVSKEKIDYHQIQYKKHHHSILNRKEQKQLRNNKNCRQLKYEYSPLLKYIRLEKGIITNNTQYKQIKNQIK
ncbi:hypothetical protein OXV68_21780 [Bacteroides fragilis]|nr:hypothetical protein [Bacteroides fragilis]